MAVRQAGTTENRTRLCAQGRIGIAMSFGGSRFPSPAVFQERRAGLRAIPDRDFFCSPKNRRSRRNDVHRLATSMFSSPSSALPHCDFCAFARLIGRAPHPAEAETVALYATDFARRRPRVSHDRTSACVDRDLSPRCRILQSDQAWGCACRRKRATPSTRSGAAAKDSARDRFIAAGTRAEPRRRARIT
jgi:hypothetical protein